MSKNTPSGSAAELRPSIAPTMTPKARLDLVRRDLAAQGFDGIIIPLCDPFLNEFVPDSARDLTWVSGFSGSSGMAIVLKTAAALFSDGRYSLQMESEVDQSLWQCHTISDQEEISVWLSNHCKSGERIVANSWCQTQMTSDRWNRALTKAGAVLCLEESNPLQQSWSDRPAPPMSPAWHYPIAYAGVESRQKRGEIAQKLTENRIDTVILTAPESINWLLNLRGSDSPNTPIVLSFALLHQDCTVDWFIDQSRLSDELKTQLGNDIRLHQPEDLLDELKLLAQQKIKIQLDSSSTNLAITRHTQNGIAEVVFAPDPCLLPKAIKNATELNGSRDAHHRDGVAMVKFLYWFEKQQSNELYELDISAKILELRKVVEKFYCESFQTIAAAGANAALPHYHPSQNSNQRLIHGEIFLLDSGGQYLDGTTDITRTIWRMAKDGAPPPAAICRHYTLVLQGHINLAEAVFPTGTSGTALDVLARMPLWQAGLNYNHGTGHGVGGFLSVHEGPQNISQRANSIALKPGMIISNEPGYYRPTEYGIRIENLVAVTELPLQTGFDQQMLGFETLTLAPIDRRLIIAEQLTQGARNWLNNYHQRVYRELAPHLLEDEKNWLYSVTKSI